MTYYTKFLKSLTSTLATPVLLGPLLFFTFLAIIILPMIIIIFFIKKYLYNNSTPSFKRNSYDNMKNGHPTFIDAEYKKDEEKEL